MGYLLISHGKFFDTIPGIAGIQVAADTGDTYAYKAGKPWYFFAERGVPVQDPC